MSDDTNGPPASGKNPIARNPLAAVAIAAVTGAIVARVLPKSAREAALLRPVARGTLKLLGKTKDLGIATQLPTGINTAAISSGLAGLIGTALKRRVEKSESRDPE